MNNDEVSKREYKVTEYTFKSELCEEDVTLITFINEDEVDATTGKKRPLYEIHIRVGEDSVMTQFVIGQYMDYLEEDGMTFEEEVMRLIDNGFFDTNILGYIEDVDTLEQYYEENLLNK